MSPGGWTNQAERHKFADQVLRMRCRLSLFLRQQDLGKVVLDLLFCLRTTQKKVEDCRGGSVEEVSLPGEWVEDNRFVVEFCDSKTLARDKTAGLCEVMPGNASGHRAATRDV